MEFIVINCLSGIGFGSLLFILAVGFSLVIGLMGILNLAHGAVFMVGAYIGWTVAAEYGLNFGLAILAGGLGAGLVGLVIERGFLCHLYKQIYEQVLLTAGFMYIVTNLCLWIWGGIARPPFVPPLLSVSFPIVGWEYPVYRIAIIVIGLIFFIGFWWFQEKTRAGAIVRAGMDDKEMTMGLGINLRLVATLVFFLAAFITGCAGVIGIQLMGADLQLTIYILQMALVIVVIGGIGTIQGTFVGSMVVGLIDVFGKALFPDLAMFTIFLAMIFIILLRPRGLLGRKGVWG